MGMKISTIFEVRKPSKDITGVSNQRFDVLATGQEACNAIRKANPKRKIMLTGFQVNDKFIPANLN